MRCKFVIWLVERPTSWGRRVAWRATPAEYNLSAAVTTLESDVSLHARDLTVRSQVNAEGVTWGEN